MSYDPDKLAVERLSESAYLGWFVIGESRLGLAEDVRTPVDASVVTVADGYSLGDGGELSLDPATATVSFTETIDGPVGTPTLTLPVGSRCAVTYDDVTIFVGVVTVATVQSSPDGYGKVKITSTYSLASKEIALFGQTVTWASLPAETAEERLERWGFTLHSDTMAVGHLYRLALEVPAEDSEGSSTLLDQARAFSAVTGLPLRFANMLAFDQWDQLTVYDTATDWPDQALVPATGFEDANDFSTEATWSTRPNSADPAKLIPDSVHVKADDTRLLSGQESVTIAPSYLGTTFRIGLSRLGSGGSIYVGLQSGSVVDVFGTNAVVSRVTQRFTSKHYSAELELAAPLSFLSEGSIFDPETLGPVVRYVADDASGGNGDEVTTLPARDGHGVTLSKQGTTGPLLATGLLGGHSALDTEPVDGYLRVMTGAYALTYNAFTVFVLARMGVSSFGGDLFLMIDSSDSSPWVEMYTDASLTEVWAYDDADHYIHQTYPAGEANEIMMLEMRHEAGATSLHVRLNGVDLTPTVLHSDAVGTSTIASGHYRMELATSFGKWFESIMFDSYLTGTDLANMRLYFAETYGVST
jgi:hypothetical protein